MFPKPMRQEAQLQEDSLLMLQVFSDMSSGQSVRPGHCVRSLNTALTRARTLTDTRDFTCTKEHGMKSPPIQNLGSVERIDAPQRHRATIGTCSDRTPKLKAEWSRMWGQSSYQVHDVVLWRILSLRDSIPLDGNQSIQMQADNQDHALSWWTVWRKPWNHSQICRRPAFQFRTFSNETLISGAR